MEMQNSSQLHDQRQVEDRRRAFQHPSLHHIIPLSSTPPPRTASSTPMTSPGLFSPGPRPGFANPSASNSNTPTGETTNSPYLHPLQHHKVRETHKAFVDSDSITGRKSINQYEVIEEIGRGMHGKVKLARNLQNGENVAIKIIPRYSKKRRLGKVMAMSPHDKTMREIAILKKMRHPNVVSLLEIIDDPELRKIYLILEHVELGEIVWRKKGLPHICHIERRRIEREMRGETFSPEEENYNKLLEHRHAINELKRAKMLQAHAAVNDYWSMEHGVADDDASYASSSQPRVSSADDLSVLSTAARRGSSAGSLVASLAPTSQAPSRTSSVRSMARPATARSSQMSFSDASDDIETPAAQRSSNGSAVALEGTMYGAYVENGTFRGRSPSMADSIISHMSSVDWNPAAHDPFAEDFSYVPCFTLEQARTVFRDTVLGLEYLHYQGVVHRDIKPANLLWTKDHRVKISDFGVSYFGRPIRDGEPDDECVSESEAQDFDDDRELARSVGTPAFFAPELCYTDTDRRQLPKISEMIDIWSLGVALYCMIYARIPFQAEDEWVMFRKIAHEDVLIPKKRLRPVDPATRPDVPSLYKRQNLPPYRDDNELAYEDIPEPLQDLLRRMFIKDPDKRIRLKDIKRHPWVVEDIPDLSSWLEETDPARPSDGRRVQVDAREAADAVVPITFLQRARSAVKKAVGKVMHPLVERSDSKSRRRATSSVASSAGDSAPPGSGPNPWDRRKSFRMADDYFSNVKDFAPGADHPLSQSMAAPSSDAGYDPLATTVPPPPQPQTQPQWTSPWNGSAQRVPRDENASNPSAMDQPVAGSSSPSPLSSSSTSAAAKSLQRHFNSFLTLTADPPRQARTVPTTPCVTARTHGRQQREQDDLTFSRSVDRDLFSSADKRDQPITGLSSAPVPGATHRRRTRPRPARSVDLGKAAAVSPALASPLFFSAQAVNGYQNGRTQPNSNSTTHGNEREHMELPVERPQTAHRVQQGEENPDAKSASASSGTSSSLNNSNSSNRTSFATKLRTDVGPSDEPCPVSPDAEDAQYVSRGSTTETCKSSRSTSMAGLTTPLTSPSGSGSPMSSACPSKERMLPFQSDPSLPALLSGGSSVSAEPEAELPVNPTAVSAAAPQLLDTTESLTPPALTKESMAGFPIEDMEQQAALDRKDSDNAVIAVQLDSPKPPTDVASCTPKVRPTHEYHDDDSDSDSDGGLLMAKLKK
ncbi:hypothetical protein ACRALDRAFT_2121887, partial [Sodiomyces alcalophilus JCM 7366]|uniref:uncharacterized protein n=1 Tax=Sodiomyces alcalophilus JCM 7366 TaxID=591952 RepID=UPI0039B39C36